MSNVKAMLKGMNISQVGHLPVVATFCRRIGLADVINAAVPTQMAVDVGTVVQLMVLDTLSGRSPLYRLERFARSVDTGLLLGRNIPALAFNDTTQHWVGRWTPSTLWGPSSSSRAAPALRQGSGLGL